MTAEQLERRALHLDLLRAGYSVPDADKLVSLVLGPWRMPEGCSWQTRENYHGEFGIWDRDCNDD